MADMIESARIVSTTLHSNGLRICLERHHGLYIEGNTENKNFVYDLLNVLGKHQYEQLRDTHVKCYINRGKLISISSNAQERFVIL